MASARECKDVYACSINNSGLFEEKKNRGRRWLNLYGEFRLTEEEEGRFLWGDSRDRAGEDKARNESDNFIGPGPGNEFPSFAVFHLCVSPSHETFEYSTSLLFSKLHFFLDFSREN